MLNEAGGFLEPEDVFNVDTQPEYPFNNVTQTESGHIFEFDDTLHRERLKLMHRTGTFIEMFPDGSEVHKVYGDGYEITVKNKQVLIQGKCSVTIEGDSIIEIRGDKIEKISGDYQLLIGGNFTQEVKKRTRIISDRRIDLISDPNFGGELNLNAGQSVQINGDIHVNGEVMCDKLVATTRIDAGHGVYAGPAGFVTLWGGVSVGIPIAFPGCVTSIAYVNAGVAVNAPFGNWFVSTAVLMTDLVNTSIFDWHSHICPDGWTSPAIPFMV
jgi:hypothetical protein